MEGLNGFDSFLETGLRGENRRKIRHVMSKINNNYKVEFKKGTEKDLELLFELNKMRFGKNSHFHMEHRKQIHRDFLTLFPHDLFTIYLNGVIKAVGMGIIHKKIYHGLISGYDYEINDLGKFVFLSKMKRAMELGCVVYDAGKNDNGWKEQLGLARTPQYKLSLEEPQAGTNPTIPVVSPLHTTLYLGRPSRSKKYLHQT